MSTQKPYSDLEGFKPYMVQGHAPEFRRVMFANGFSWECASCGISEWLGQKAPLQIDHIDGDRLNNCRSNLRFLCPNCHALTETFGGRHRRRRADLTVDEIVAAFDQAVANNGYASVAGVMRVLGRRTRNRAEYERVVKVCTDHSKELRLSAPRCRRAKRSGGHRTRTWRTCWQSTPAWRSRSVSVFRTWQSRSAARSEGFPSRTTSGVVHETA